MISKRLIPGLPGCCLIIHACCCHAMQAHIIFSTIEAMQGLHTKPVGRKKAEVTTRQKMVSNLRSLEEAGQHAPRQEKPATETNVLGGQERLVRTSIMASITRKSQANYINSWPLREALYSLVDNPVRLIASALRPLLHNVTWLGNEGFVVIVDKLGT
ncbi:hypothetical protein BGX38DRAFT_341596 [Terfezia claveryi]|nr:hypothetical protein BGX38DRAFT_341596 [Terfezia claveryi]